MPIKIKELLIKANVGDKKEEKKSVKSSKTLDESSSKLSYSQKKQIVEECTREVLEKIKRLNDF